MPNYQLWIAWLTDKEKEELTQEQEDDMMIDLQVAFEQIKAGHLGKE